MSSVEHYRLALLQYIQYQQQMEAVLRLREEVAELRAQIALRHKKHRRCDREITKQFKVAPSLIQCLKCEKFYASDIALKLHLKLKHPRNDEKENSTEDSHGLVDNNSRELNREEVPHTSL